MRELQFLDYFEENGLFLGQAERVRIHGVELFDFKR